MIFAIKYKLIIQRVALKLVTIAFCKGVTSDFWQVIFATNNKCMLQRLSITFCNGKQVSFETSTESFLQRVIFRMSNKWFLYGVTSDFTTSKERRAICYES